MYHNRSLTAVNHNDRPPTERQRASPRDHITPCSAASPVNQQSAASGTWFYVMRLRGKIVGVCPIVCQVTEVEKPRRGIGVAQ